MQLSQHIGRRALLRGGVKFAALAALPVAALAPRAQAAEGMAAILWGDGVADDAPAIQALFDGRPVFDWQTRAVRRGERGTLRLTRGRYRIDGPVRLHDAKRIEIAENRIVLGACGDLDMEGVGFLDFSRNHIDLGGGAIMSNGTRFRGATSFGAGNRFDRLALKYVGAA